MNLQVLLLSRPTGIAKAVNFALRGSLMPAPAAKQILVGKPFLSVEPAMHGWIADVGNYPAPSN